MEQLGVMSLSAALKGRGHRTRLALGTDKDILRAAVDFSPHIVGVTVLTGYQRRWLRLARAIKEAVKPAPIAVFGGPHATFFPEIALEEGVDFACRGEGDGAMVELAESAEPGGVNNLNINNLCYADENGALKKNPMRPLEDLDSLPFPDRELSFAYPFIRRDPNTHFMAGRGCPYSCSFCFNRKYNELCKNLGPAVRFRSSDSLIDEIRRVREKWGIKVVYFQDDTFVLDRGWLYPFLESYGREIGLPLYCAVRADLVDEEMAGALKDAGCYRVSFGVESGVESIRRELLGKRISDEQLREAAMVLANAGIPFQTTNMMGLPGESLDDAFKTLRLNIEIGAEIAWTSLYQPYPGTELGEKALEEGFIKNLPDDERIADAHTSSILETPDIREIERLQKFAYLAVKFPSTLPLIRKLVRRHHPHLYHWLHRITYLLFYFRKITKMTWRRAIEEAYIAWKYY